MERTRLSREIIETCLEMTRLGIKSGDSGECQRTLLKTAC